MDSGVSEMAISRYDLESLLENALVPVEPNLRFIRRLRARLVRVRGGDVPSAWVGLAALAAVTLFFLASIGLALRIMLAILGLVSSGGRETDSA